MSANFVHFLPPEEIAELERRFQFRYLAKNGFEAKEEVFQKGREKWERGEVLADAIELGKRWIREIQSAFVAKSQVVWINDRVGHGLMAASTIPKGAFTGEYTGIVRENNRRYLEPLNDYCYEYPVVDEIGRSFVIDATQGNLMRFINHSEAPNLQPKYAFIDGAYHCIFLALHEIVEGTQLNYDYGKSYWYLREAPERLISMPR
jgi:SET domain-containing protein